LEDRRPTKILDHLVFIGASALGFVAYRRIGGGKRKRPIKNAEQLELAGGDVA
jgi:hypothetical protein